MPEEEATKIYKKRKQQKTDLTETIDKWRETWREYGPVRFAEEVLTNPPDAPPHPTLGILKNMVLSNDQKEFLNDIWKGGVNLAIVSAGRGAGKTLVLAVWNCWRVTCFDHWSISCMSGSQRQSRQLQKYIDYWRDTVPEIKYCINKSIKGIEPAIYSRMGGECKFLPCSTTAARGPHVPEVQIDEAVEAEAKSQEGAEAVDAIWWQITGKKVGRVFMTSTTHYLGGKFYKYLTDAEYYGFKPYYWAIAKHISGKSPEITYTDKNPDHWEPNVWWVTMESLRMLRRAKSDDEFLCEALGKPSRASGTIFRVDDLNACICDQCEECRPYQWGYCKLIEQFKLGDSQNPTRDIIERRMSFDYGSPAPCALTVGGKKGKYIFILYNDEQRGLGPDEITEWLDITGKMWSALILIPDPSCYSHVGRKAEEKGFTVYLIDSSKKSERIFNCENFIERHFIIIPKSFWILVSSLKQATRDEKGNVRKVNDHGFDTLCYLLDGWNVEEDSGGAIFDVLLGQERGSRTTETTKERDINQGVILW